VIMKRILFHLLLLSALAAQTSLGIDNLKLNQKLDYQSDSVDGPLITGDDAQAGFLPGKTNYVIIYGEGCFNSKRQARRTVELYNKYRNQVHFVVVDLDVRRSPEQQQLVKQYYKGYIPHVVILDANGKALYDSDGEVDFRVIEGLFEKSFAQARESSRGPDLE
jgi:thiol-disulfide isomerase/thioredoxin